MVSFFLSIFYKRGFYYICGQDAKIAWLEIVCTGSDVSCKTLSDGKAAVPGGENRFCFNINELPSISL